LLSFSAAAELNNADALTLNLLPTFPYQLDLQSRGTLGKDTFRIDYQASQGGVRVAGVFSNGLFEDEEGARYRVANPLYSILTEIARINEQEDAQKKLAHFAALKTFLPEDIEHSNINPETFLLRVRIAHVTAISLRPTIADGNVSFDPVPMRRRDTEDPSAGAELAIPPVACDKFAQEFRAQRDINSTYALESGNYVYIDPSVRAALRVVKKKQAATLEERVAFLMSPSAAISKAYGESSDGEADGSIGDTVFFETAEYSERVTGIGEWLPPQITYLEKSENNWLPERFSVILGDKLVTGKPEDVPVWIESVKAAIASQKPAVEIGEVSIPTNTPGLLLTLQKLNPPEPTPRGEDDPNSIDELKPKKRIQILQTISNLDQAEFKRQLKPRRLSNSSLPQMKTRLKDHQRDGVTWLSSSYVVGWPGVLLADDMGLGKTLQSLSFLMLLRREGIIRKGRPALVIAPTSLLRNWQEEHRRHTLDGGLGDPLVAFGSELRKLKIGDAAGDAITLLNTSEIANSPWVLATYEAIRDYHLSFARIPFSVAILDEIQKAKNPATRINATLKTLNVDFVVAMTGTPVENSISDLWAITDIAAPGYLPPLKDFMKRYGSGVDQVNRQKALEALSRELLQPAEVGDRSITPYALRRLKEDVAKDLPAKHQGPMLRADMPARQAERYAEVSSAAQAGQIQILRALHDFRSISLHPIDPETVGTGILSGDEYIQLSARLTLAFKKLEHIAALDEKVIIFVHNRRMQTLLSRLIQHKFGCPKPEYIRGDTIPGQRQEIVDRFSSLKGFAALILSPRAAGVGLNIVAANHVIHLDRWWNPAVEDQCTDRAYRIGATKDVFVHTIGAVHPHLRESSYDVILDQLLRTRRDTSKRIFTASDIFADDFMKVLQKVGAQSNEDVLNEIDQSGYLGLEEFVRDKLIAAGLTGNLTYRTGDGGADIVVRDECGQINYLVQCKFTSKIEVPLDAGLSDDASRMRGNWQAPKATVVGVTNARKFAPRVISQFKQIGGQLIARDQLLHFSLS
jgi:hypothetical protein